MRKRLPFEFIPVEQLIRALKYWWLIALFMLGGGVTGFIVHTILPPIYESRVEITTSIDFLQTGVLTDEQQDQAVDAVGDLIGSTLVKNSILEKINNENDSFLTLQELQKSAFLERQEYRWRIRVRMSEPEIAKEIANIWGREALNQLQAASEHAVLANSLSEYVSNLENCLETTSVVMPVYEPCDGNSSELIKQEINAISPQLQNEKLESKGIIPAMTFYISEEGQISTTPVSNNRNLLVFGFSILGFILGIVFLQISKFHGIKKK